MTSSLPPAPYYREHPLRIACVQYDVKLGKVQENSAKVESMTARLAPGSVDLVVLPEMALSGYMFSSATSIMPYLEDSKTGPTATLASKLANRLRCHVVAGYPEVVESRPQAIESNGAGNSSTSGTSTSEAAPAGLAIAQLKEKEAEAHGVGYNSAVIAGPTGEIIGNYRKAFHFETDKNWGREGDGFHYWDLPQPLGRVAVGICMDLNPRDFIAPWNAFEFATFCVKNAVDVIVMPMNWLDPAEQDSDTSDEDEDGEPLPPANDPNAPSESNLNYWAARLTPLHDPAPGYSDGADTEPSTAKQVVFVASNRVGTEEGTRFCGTSAVMTVSSTPSQIELVECCNRSEERVMLAVVA